MDPWGYLLKFTTLRPRSEKEIRDWFKRKKIDEDKQVEWMTKLIDFGFVNDEAFAKWWVEQRLAFKPKAKKALEFELKGKGVSKDIIQSVLDSTELNEEEIASDLLNKGIHKWQGEKGLVKAQMYLARKGFSWEVIDRATSKIVK